VGGLIRYSLRTIDVHVHYVLCIAYLNQAAKKINNRITMQLPIMPNNSMENYDQL